MAAYFFIRETAGGEASSVYAPKSLERETRMEDPGSVQADVLSVSEWHQDLLGPPTSSAFY
jgi:hypothetical protein